MKKTIYRPAMIFLVGIAAVMSFPAMGQRFYNNPVSQYYRDGYLWNPSLAGQEGTRLYGLLNKSWIGFDGAPQLVNLSGDMKLGENSGVGIQLSADKSGIFRRYTGALTYAYSIKFSENQRLRLGGDVGFYQERLDNSSLIDQGGQVDPEGKSLNDKSLSFDGDMGLSYEAGGLTIGAAGYNLSAYTKSSADRSADLAIAQFLGAYRFTSAADDRLTIEPMVAYKMFYDHTNIVTVATQLEYAKAFHASLYWQSTGNLMGGLGILLKQFGEVNFFYSGKNKYGYNQQYEVGLKYKIK